MEKDQIEKLRQLRDAYDYARTVCDPIEFAKRQQSLMYSLCNFLINPLQEYEEERKGKNNGMD